MKRILVGVKRVVDYNIRVRVKPDGSGVALDGVKMSLNPFDETAVEEALRIKERGKAREIVAECKRLARLYGERSKPTKGLLARAQTGELYYDTAAKAAARAS
jgi:hypothetical protein